MTTYLWFLHVFHSEVEPDSEAWVAGVWPDEQVIFKLCDVVHPAKVPCQEQMKQDVF